MDTQIYNTPMREGFNPIAVGYKTDKGRKRSGNEDSHAVFTREELGGLLDGLFVVADGMGGTKGGEIASNIVINSLPEEVQAGIAGLSGDDLQPQLATLLNRSIQRANEEVWSYKQQHEGLQGMGTTCVAAMIAHSRLRNENMQGVLALANVGDSRAYLLRRGQLSQITEDHSEVWEQVKAGKMTPEQAATSRFRNTITRAMGLRSTVKPDINIRNLEAGDVVLLCSDGLTTEVDDLTIARLLASSADPQIACDRLVEAALTNGGSDNITVVALHYGAFTPLETATSTREPLNNNWQEEEDVTDPNQAWKRSLGSGRSTQREALDEREDRYASPARDRYSADVAVPQRGVSPVLFGLILLAALAEGIGLYWFWAGKIPSKTPAPKPQPVAVRPTDKPLAYEHPLPLYWQSPLWEGALQLMPDGRLLVVTTKGQELAISPGGTASIVGNATATPLPLTQPVKRLDGSLKPVPILPFVTVDASGNRYELNPTTRSIDKYDAAGVMQAHNIGRGSLQAPSSLAVDNSGNLYVIDTHVLKKFVAVPDTGQAANAAKLVPTPTVPTPAPDKAPSVARPSAGEAANE